MVHALISIYIIQIIVMLICLRIIYNGNAASRRSMLWLVTTAILTAASYTVSIMIPANYPDLAVLMEGLYFIGTDWLVIALLYFVADYAYLHQAVRIPKLIFTAVACVDSVSLFINAFARHMFTMEREALTWMEYWQIRYTPLHYIHMYFVYFMVVFCVSLLLYRMIKSANIYKSKYGVLFSLILVVVVLNVLRVVLGFRFDYSVLLYGLLVMAICYFVLHVSPLKLMEKMNSTLVEDSVIGLFVYNDDKKCVGVNNAAKELFGKDDDEIYSVAEVYLQKWEEEYQGQMKTVMGAERKIEKDGEEKYIYVNYQRLLDEKGRVLGSGFQFEDRTEIEKKNQANKYKATHDGLTGLLNRDGFEASVREILNKSDKQYYMMCSNIKDFKLINELCGSDVGDRLLVTQAGVIRRDEAGDSVSCRVYADKFCTLLPKEDYNEEMFGKNMDALMNPVLSVPLKIQFHFGIYEITDKKEPVWTMCDKAMLAIDEIHGSYEKNFNFYTKELLERIIKEKEILGDFDRAIANDEFHMFLQPQVTSDGKLVGAEALVRWIHPGKGIVSPAEFIPVLEKSVLIHKLDLLMWEKAAQQLEKWKKSGQGNLFISVNISTKDFYLIDVHEAFRALSEKYDFDIRNLKLEITESALVKDIRKIMKTMEELHAQGYEIEIDDFGSGYSSLGMLKDIHADILKLDMIFLRDTENAERSTTILKNVISMSKELGMPVVTEGVEKQEHVDFLRHAGCDILQGFYFSKPIPVDHFEREYAVGD